MQAERFAKHCYRIVICSFDAEFTDMFFRVEIALSICDLCQVIETNFEKVCKFSAHLNWPFKIMLTFEITSEVVKTLRFTRIIHVRTNTLTFDTQVKYIKDVDILSRQQGDSNPRDYEITLQ